MLSLWYYYCAKGFESHSFDSKGKYYYCNILGCAVGLQSHSFDSKGKCYNGDDILGCQYGFQSHSFDSKGRCYYCSKNK